MEFSEERMKEFWEFARKNQFSDSIMRKYSLKKFTSVKTGGCAEFYFLPQSILELQTVFKYILAHKIPYFVLGTGSNLLISDQGISGVVISLQKLPVSIKAQSGVVKVSANLENQQFTNYLIQNGLTGLEFLRGIPGTIGGMLRMNAGAFARTIIERLKSLSYFDSQGNIRKSSQAEIDSEYRSIKLGFTDYIIFSAEFQLEISSPESVQGRCDEFMEMRKSKAILHLPTFGSTFKNGEDYFAGELVDKCGLKGYSVGGAMISEKHANFIINKGKARSIDIYRLINYVQKKVYEKFQVKLEREVIYWGDFNYA